MDRSLRRESLLACEPVLAHRHGTRVHYDSRGAQMVDQAALGRMAGALVGVVRSGR